MKATFEFDLSDPEQVTEHYRMTRSIDMALALRQISDLWRKYKHDEELPTSEMVFNDIQEIMDDYYLNMENLI